MVTALRKSKLSELAELEQHLKHHCETLSESRDALPSLLERAWEDEATSAVRQECDELLSSLDRLLDQVGSAKHLVEGRIGGILANGP
jgi:ubiquinone biosynthesis protein UbiJ